ncbi:hypothetical protein BJ684DRAFT_19715 [Piptocephalis cylindrospora]|uniref:E3 ubiquitin-protein ligase n=1 Tax=Piptocephalis cylindrospora TaxID=1907219 RepID=A0A4P9Y6G1_9FUNG|nr:hypothetical protein BJ684DRAFT_19715 [Piptocephalis cylindrospora]|eukprot:RKP13821.1 hypothetical protein BJ684DRAFT_19715 [Piptocephalis cylindrospora]
MDKLMFGVSAQCGYRRFGLTVPLVLARIEAALPSTTTDRSALIASPICGKYLNQSDIFYRCRECGMDNTCVMCAECFEASGHFHDNHDVSVSLNPSGGGCCDCGDPEAWNNPIGCPLHPDPREKGSGEGESPSDESLPDLTRLTEVMGEILDWCLDILSYSPEVIELDDIEHINEASSHLGDLGLDDKGNPIGESHETSPTSLPQPGGIEEEHGHETTKGVLYGCVLWNDETHSFDEVVSQITLAARFSDARARRIAEEVDARGRAILIHLRNLRIIHSIARKVEEIGLQLSIQKARDLWAEEEVGILLSVLARLISPEMEDASSGEGLGGPGRDSTPIHNDLAAHVRSLSHKALPLIKVALRRAFLLSTKCTSSLFDPYKRLEALLLLDARLWKEARLVTRCIYVGAILSDPVPRREMALMFAKCYKTLARCHLGVDRSPEHSTLTFSIQMFTVPSIAEELVGRPGGLLEDLIQLIIYHFRPADKYCSVLPYTPSSLGGRGLRCEHSVFHNKRLSYLTHDLTFLLGGPLARAAVLGGKSGSTLDARAIRLTHLLLAFQGMDGQVRVVGQHVEFESEGWAPAFGLTMQLTQVVEAFGEALGIVGLPYISGKLVEWVDSVEKGAEKEREGEEEEEGTKEEHEKFEGVVRFHTPRSNTIPRLSQVVSFSVMSQMVSVHLPLHWLLSECIKYWAAQAVGQSETCTTNEDPHDPLLGQSLRQALGKYLTYPEGLSPTNTKNVSAQEGQLYDHQWHGIFDYPLRTWVWLSQVGAGLWVRNGYGVRRQAHLYRSVSLREHTQCADLLLIQTFLGYVELPSVWLLTLVDRFGLLGWWKRGLVLKSEGEGDDDTRMDEDSENQEEGCRGTGYDERQFRHMLEELLYLIILTIKERPHLAGWDEDRRVERALIHATALPAPYTEVMYRLPESIGRSRVLEQVMSRVASCTGEGEGPERWRLNEEDQWVDQVDPYWVHYSRNMRAELLEWKRKHQAKTTDLTSRLPHLIPIPPSSPYHGYAERLYKDESGEMMLLLVCKVWSLSKEGEEEGVGSEEEEDEVITMADDPMTRATTRTTRAGDDAMVTVRGGDTDTDEEDEEGEVGGGSGGGVREMGLHLLLLGLSMCKESFSWALHDTNLSLSGERTTLYHLLKEWIIQRECSHRSKSTAAGSQAPSRVAGVLEENVSIILATVDSVTGDDWKEDLRRRREAEEREAEQAQEATCPSDQDGSEESKEERRKREAKERQARMMADFAKAQQAFMVNHSEWLEEEEEEEGDGEGMDGEDSAKSHHPPWEYPKGTCIVCQDELGTTGTSASGTDEESTSGERGYGMLAFLQTSTHQHSARLDDQEYVAQLMDGMTHTRPMQDEGFPESPKKFKSEVAMTWTSCGHLIHADCLQGYYNSIRSRHMGQPTRRQPESVERGEFLCPLCKALGNALIPMSSLRNVEDRSTERVELRGSRNFERSKESRVFFLTPYPISVDKRMQQEGEAFMLSGTTAKSPSSREGGDRTNESPGETGTGEEEGEEEGESEGEEEEDGSPPEPFMTHARLDGQPIIRLTSISLAQRMSRGKKAERKRSWCVRGASDVAQQARRLWREWKFDVAGIPRVETKLGGADLLCHTLTATLAEEEIIQRSRSKESQAVTQTRLTFLRGLSEMVVTSAGDYLMDASGGLQLRGRALEAGMGLWYDLRSILEYPPLQILVELSVWTWPWLPCATDQETRGLPLSDYLPRLWAMEATRVILHLITQVDLRQMQELDGTGSSSVKFSWMAPEEPDHEAYRGGMKRLVDRLIQWYGPEIRFPKEVRKALLTTRACRLVWSFLGVLLRRMVLFMQVRYGLEWEAEGEGGSKGEMDRMLAWLGLPQSLDGLFPPLGKNGPESDAYPGLHYVMHAICLTHLRVYGNQNPPLPPPTLASRINLPDPAPIGLIRLTHRLDTLFRYARRRCPRCHKVPSEPAVCLACGAILCSQSFCCMRNDVGECTQHYMR